MFPLLKVGTKKLLIEAKKRKKRICSLFFRLPFERQREIYMYIYIVFVVYSLSLQRINQGLGRIDDTLAKENIKTLVCSCVLKNGYCRDQHSASHEFVSQHMKKPKPSLLTWWFCCYF